MKKTGVRPTEEEKKILLDLVGEAMKAPVITIAGVCVSSTAWVIAEHKCHQLALAHGLPEIVGLYGLDKDGEFVLLE